MPLDLVALSIIDLTWKWVANISKFETLVRDGVEDTTRNCWMFVDKKTGDVYKPASYKACEEF